jgi:hypothetical protein
MLVKRTLMGIGATNRKKGHDYERLIAKEMRALGFPDAATTRSKDLTLDADKVDICNAGIYHIQCKKVKNSVQYTKILEEMPVDDKVNVIFHCKGVRATKKELVIMTKEDFYKIVDPRRIDKSSLKEALLNTLSILDDNKAPDEDLPDVSESNGVSDSTDSTKSAKV